MTEEEIKSIYTLTDGIVDVERERIVNDISIKSRLKYIDDEKAKNVAKFLIDYCFKDSKEVYSNGIIMVDMFRVLDALSMINKRSIQYCDCC